MIPKGRIENPTLRQMYETQLEFFRTCLNFPCVCCGEVKKKKVGMNGGEVHIYESKDPMLANRTAPAVYQVCDACLGLPEEERQSRVTAWLSKRPGFLGGGGDKIVQV